MLYDIVTVAAAILLFAASPWAMLILAVNCVLLSVALDGMYKCGPALCTFMCVFAANCTLCCFLSLFSAPLSSPAVSMLAVLLAIRLTYRLMVRRTSKAPDSNKPETARGTQDMVYDAEADVWTTK